jgi:ribonuclease HI
MIIYTDGSCSSNPNGVGAWSYVVLDSKKKEIIKSRVGRDYVTTSNRMELTGILEALKDFKDIDCIISDSKYAVNCISGKWKAKVNLDLINEAKGLLKNRDILRWVKGHSGIEGNEIADALCNEEMKSAFLERNGFQFVEYNYSNSDIF